jgi:hypothetical protein
VTWDGFAKFAAQLVGWTLPAPQVEGLAATAALRDDRAVLHVDAADDASLPRNFLEISATLVGPDLTTSVMPLSQVGAGRYEAGADVLQPGTYLVQLGVSEGGKPLGQQTLGLVVPYSPEYRASGVDRGLLSELARLTGGGELAEPGSAFAHDLPAAQRAREVWAALLLIAALLFPIDVAIRRVMLGRRDVDNALAWVRSRLAGPRAAASRPERALGQLFQARARARRRGARSDGPPTSPGTPPPPIAGPSTPPPAGPTEGPPPERPPAGPGQPPSRPPAAPPADAGDSLARLREAKKRAKRER